VVTTLPLLDTLSLHQNCNNF